MKRIISLLFALVIMISTTTISFATNNGEEYYTVQVEYSDNIGQLEQLDIMIQNNNVFVDAKMLAERLGYTFDENSEGVIIYNENIYNNLPFSTTQFRYNSTQVSHMLFNNMIDTYEAPFVSVKNSKGSWIPLEYSLLIINSSMMITDNALLIDVPTKRIIDYFFDIAKNSSTYQFDWADDFGYTETDINILGGSSHLINVFNGLLEFDGASWAVLFQQFFSNMDAYDKKYGENLAMLLCTESQGELDATIEKIELLLNLLNYGNDKNRGELAQILINVSNNLDSDVKRLYENCKDILEKVKNGNSPLVSYNRSYQALEKALDRQTWFSNTGGNILKVQKSVSNIAGKTFDFLNVGIKMLEVAGYIQEFQNQDEFSLAALIYYLNNANSGLDLPEAIKKSMIDYSDVLSSSIGKYTITRFVEENVDQWIIDKFPIHKMLGTQAVTVLFAWNIASNTIPFIANGLSSADNFELALYSMVFQGDTFLNYLSKRNSVFADIKNITAENAYNLSQYCYIYLKSCYITREAALASLTNKITLTKENIQPLVDYQNRINGEIAKILVELKNANKTNKYCVFGFLPTDNKNYLSKYDDRKLIEWVKASNAINVYNIHFQNKLSSLITDIGIFTQNQHGIMHKWDDNWFNPEGIISATILDFDSDSIPEMLVCYTQPTNYNPTAYKIQLDMYELSGESVILSDSILFSPYYDNNSVDSWNAIITLSSTMWYQMYLGIHPVWTEHGCIFMCEDIESYHAFADGFSQNYWTLTYHDNKFQYLCSFTQTGGGSSDFQYTGFEFSNGILTSSNLYYSEWEEDKPLFNDFDTALQDFFSKYNINVIKTGMKSILAPNNNSIKLCEFQNTMVTSDYLSSTFQFIANLYIGENDALNVCNE